MKLKNINLLACLAVLFSAYSCSDDADSTSPTHNGNVAVSVAAGFAPKSDPQTFASDDAWAANDIIGLTMLNKEGKEVIAKNFNFMYTTPTGSTNFVPRSPENTAYFPQDGSDVKLKGYYPYNAKMGADMKTPISVIDQNNLPIIDFMSADHLKGFSKDDPTVHLNFRHRLSKLVFNLSITDNDETVPLKDFELTIKGMKTTGVYDLFAELLNVDEGSTKNIAVPYRGKDAERNSIVLPRAAADGVSFEFKAPNGHTYTAKMRPELALQAGYIYTFNIKLQKTPVTVSATINEWIVGSTINLEPKAITVGGTLDNTTDFFKHKNIDIYKHSPQFSSHIYSYVPAGSTFAWTGSSLYWDDQILPLKVTGIHYPTGSTKPAVQNETTQFAWDLPTDQSKGYDKFDILTSFVSLSAPEYVNFKFTHAMSKVKIEVSSDEFTAAQLVGSKISLKNFILNGTIKVVDGKAVTGAGAKDVAVLTDADGSKYSALVMPQSIKAGTPVVLITLRDYPNTPFIGELSTPLNFEAGKEAVIKLKLKRTAIELSATLEPWTPGEEGSIIIQ